MKSRLRAFCGCFALSVAVQGLAGGFGSQPPDPASSPAVWTGTEMIVWSGTGTRSGGRLNVAAQRWSPLGISSETPEGRADHTAIWTGTEMIVWGGWALEPSGYVRDDGGIYEPISDTWRPTGSAMGVVEGRAEHTAVWTGTEMIVWGGRGSGVSLLKTGGVYDPATESWRATTSTGAPEARFDHTAVWTGTEMIVWGGARLGSNIGNGARYDPTTDRWTPMASASAPEARSKHTAVWTGTEMIVWGGAGGTNTGGLYDPVTDTWKPTSTDTNVPSARSRHSAAWTGTEMLIWGGNSDPGGRYDPVADDWATLPLDPSVEGPRKDHACVWTGSEMVVWGGVKPNGNLLDTGGIYDPAQNSWTPTPHDAPGGRNRVDAVWTGSELIVWGGWNGADYLGSGGRYDPSTDSWQALPTDPATPSPRMRHSMVWTGQLAIVWGGGASGTGFSDGARYEPATDTWTPVTTSGAPTARSSHSAVWTGSEMIVWGGTLDQSGGRYDPTTDTWLPTSTSGSPPSPRYGHTAVWTGSEMLIWSGAEGATGIPVDTGARYDPTTDLWTSMSNAGAPAGSIGIPAVWTGSELVVRTNSFGRYDPSTDGWSPLGSPPLSSQSVDMAWTGSELLVWGGDPHTQTTVGLRSDLGSGGWTSMSAADEPTARGGHRCVWTGREMLVWGGSGSGWVGSNGWGNAPLSSGGVYDAASDQWRSARPSPANVIAAQGPGPAYNSRIVSYRGDGSPTGFVLEAFPATTPGGANVAVGDVQAGGTEELLAAPGPETTAPPRIRGFDATGLPLGGLDFMAYGTTGFGARAATAHLTDRAAILTGPGPSSVYGPHVRGFGYGVGPAVAPLPGLSFYAYGTLRFGVHVAAADLTRDGAQELLTGAGTGAVFGPHVRAFDYTGTSVAAMAKVSFFAFQTLHYGVEIGAGDVDHDGYGEILASPGPSAAFPASLRGFDVDGGSATSIASINAVVFSGSRYGANPAGADVDGDGFDEILVGAGADPAFSSSLTGLDYDGTALAPIPGLTLDPFGLSYGVRVAGGALGV